MKTLFSLTILSFAVGSLTACSQTREQFDFSKKAPDEFAVITRAPLEMPETLDLPPPRPGAERPQEASPENEAKQALFGNVQEQTENLTSGESILLQKAQADKTDSNIRDVVDAETQEVIKENTSTFDKIMGKAGKKIDAPAEVVDPIKERERILQNQEAGKPLTDGQTPSLEQ